MTPDRETDRILVVSRDPDLVETIRKVTDTSVVIDRASNHTEALEKVKTTRPGIVVLVDDEPVGALAKFYFELRQGWISRHSSVLLIEPASSGDSFRLLDENYLDSELAAQLGPQPSAIPRDHFTKALKEVIVSKLIGRRNKLKAALLGPNPFCLIWEQVPGLGSFEKRQEDVLENARRATMGGKVCAISVTDNPGGNPAIATEILSREIRKLGVEPLVHVAFRDRSRNQCESLLYQLAVMDINNLLVLTGDYPSNTAFEGTSRPVFDLDSVTGLRLIAEMNRGMEHEIMLRKTILAPTDFFTGVAFSPFKQEEAEVMGQYYKLKKKIDAGANFIITQVGYDVRKLHELQLWLKARKYNIPAIASIYVLPYATAQAMHDNHVPGCSVTDKLLAEIARESASPDKGRQSRLERAAKMYAIARGLGFAGVSISGQRLPYESVDYIVDRGQELLVNWQDLLHEFDYPQSKGFYIFGASPKTGLNDDSPAPGTQRASRPPIYYFSLAVHFLVFEPRSPFFAILRGFARLVDRSNSWKKAIGTFEYWWKVVLYSCQNCGDCALFDVAYLCPVSQCPKNQRNGPCGGSYQGWCEVYPNEKKCIWVRAYRRLKARHEEDSIGESITPPCNWSLWQTSSWLNYFNGRDHLGPRLSNRESRKTGEQKPL
ncbi:methylenetetrahydrofolate reductase C-terminal domain-containing protein [Chloroflexota bacterium]